MTLPTTGLYAILDAARVAPGQRGIAAAAALSGGARLLQYRNKQDDAQAARADAEALVTICWAAGVPLILNDDPEMAAAVGAAGVHLGRSDMAVADARRYLGPQAIVGATCHDDVEAAVAAQTAGASYVSFGRFFASRTKADAPAADPAVLGRARARIGLPIVAIGGVNADNGPGLIAAGAHWLAAAHAVFGADDVRAASARLAALFPE